MKRSFRHLLPLLLTSLATGVTYGQPVAAPTPSVPDARPVEARAPRDNKERAEDAELMRQLEAESQKLDAESQQLRGEKSRADRARSKAGMAGGGPGMAEAFSFDRKNVLTRPGAGPRALVIRTGDADLKAQSTLEEDLAVMSHLLDKALEEVPGAQGNGNRAMGIDVFFAQNAAPVRSLYLDNYGALFFLKVSFPLVAPTEKHQEEKSAGDSAWEEARQELYGQRGQGNITGAQGEEFSQEKVDKLRETIFETLKNVTNIRGLKPEDYVTICVSGGGGSGRIRMAKGGPGGGNFMIAGQPGVAARRSVLTVRARKSKIDEFSQGKLSLEEFRKHALLTSYTADAMASAGSGEGVTVGTYTVRAK
jgi:hypothetical protein